MILYRFARSVVLSCLGYRVCDGCGKQTPRRCEVNGPNRLLWICDECFAEYAGPLFTQRSTADGVIDPDGEKGK